MYPQMSPNALSLRRLARRAVHSLQGLRLALSCSNVCNLHPDSPMAHCISSHATHPGSAERRQPPRPLPDTSMLRCCAGTCGRLVTPRCVRGGVGQVRADQSLGNTRCAYGRAPDWKQVEARPTAGSSMAHWMSNKLWHHGTAQLAMKGSFSTL